MQLIVLSYNLALADFTVAAATGTKETLVAVESL